MTRADRIAAALERWEACRIQGTIEDAFEIGNEMARLLRESQPEPVTVALDGDKSFAHLLDDGPSRITAACELRVLATDSRMAQHQGIACLMGASAIEAYKPAPVAGDDEALLADSLRAVDHLDSTYQANHVEAVQRLRFAYRRALADVARMTEVMNRRGMSCAPDQDMMRMAKERDEARADVARLKDALRATAEAAAYSARESNKLRAVLATAEEAKAKAVRSVAKRACEATAEWAMEDPSVLSPEWIESGKAGQQMNAIIDGCVAAEEEAIRARAGRNDAG